MASKPQWCGETDINDESSVNADSSVLNEEATVGADQATVTAGKAIAATEEPYFGDDEACPEVCPCERIFLTSVL